MSNPDDTYFQTQMANAITLNGHSGDTGPFSGNEITMWNASATPMHRPLPRPHFALSPPALPHNTGHANAYISDLKCLDQIPETDFCNYFLNNLAQIFQHDEKLIKDMLEKKKNEIDNHSILKDIRLALLRQIAGLFHDFPANSAKNRRDNYRLIVSDIHTLGSCYLNKSSYNLFKMYSKRCVAQTNPVTTMVTTEAEDNPVQFSSVQLAQVVASPTVHEVSRPLEPFSPSWVYTRNSPTMSELDTSTDYEITRQCIINSVEVEVVTDNTRTSPPSPTPTNAQSSIDLQQIIEQCVLTQLAPMKEKVTQMSKEIIYLKDENVKKCHRITNLETVRNDLTSEVAILRSLLPQTEDHSELQTVRSNTTCNHAPEPPREDAMESPRNVSTELPQREIAAHSSTTQNTGVNNSTPTPTPQSTQQHTTSNNVTQQHQQQSPPHQGQNNSSNRSKRWPRKVDQIFISQVDRLYNSVTLKDQIQNLTNIDRNLIKVERLFTKHNNTAFKVVVPHGKMQQIIENMGTNIKAEPFKERNYRPIVDGQARGSRWSNTGHRNQGDNQNTFRGPHPMARRPPPNRQSYHWRDNFGWDPSFLRPEWQYYGQYYRQPQGRYY